MRGRVKKLLRGTLPRFLALWAVMMGLLVGLNLESQNQRAARAMESALQERRRIFGRSGTEEPTRTRSPLTSPGGWGRSSTAWTAWPSSASTPPTARCGPRPPWLWGPPARRGAGRTARAISECSPRRSSWPWRSCCGTIGSWGSSSARREDWSRKLRRTNATVK